MPAHKHVFQKYPNEYFIETGTFKGEGLQMALDIGFANVRSVEIHEPYWKENLLKYHNNPRVRLYLGSSEEQLWNMIQGINVPCTFWLDGHWSGDDTPTWSGQNCPLEDELNIIKQHHIKNHTILIDDIRCCGTPHFKNKKGIIYKYELEDWIRQINRDYRIFYENSWEPNDILVATI